MANVTQGITMPRQTIGSSTRTPGTKATTNANAANEERYKQLLASLKGLGQQTQGTFGEAEQAIAGVGTAARERVNRNYTNLAGQAEQDLISRGLGNTTIRSAVQRGVESDRELAQQQIDESVANQRSGLLQNRAGMELSVGGLMSNAIQNRNDVGPDLSLYASLLQQAGGAGGTPGSVPAPLYSFVPSNPQASGVGLLDSLRSKFGTQTGGGGGGGYSFSSSSGNPGSGLFTPSMGGGSSGGGGSGGGGGASAPVSGTNRLPLAGASMGGGATSGSTPAQPASPAAPTEKVIRMWRSTLAGGIQSAIVSESKVAGMKAQGWTTQNLNYR